MKSVEGFNRLYALRLKNGRLCLGAIETSYFVTLGNAIKFGVKGHAAIIDQTGQLLAHPLPDWVAEAKNISKLSVAQAMMAGGTGIAQFFSPALKGDMIAGYTSVPGAGWGVMIPQPVEELYAEAAAAQRPIWLIAGLAVIAALMIAVFVSNRVARPLEIVVRAARSSRETGVLVEAEGSTACCPLKEQREIVESYNAMVHSLQGNEREMKRLAFTDSLTGLLNRAAFSRLAEQMFAESARTDTECAMDYFDLDGFKAINDQHGHASGDLVLVETARRVKALVEKHYGARYALDPLDLAQGDNVPNLAPLVARIGGDEFTVFLPKMAQDCDIDKFAKALVKVISEPIDHEEGYLTAATSVGIARFPEDAKTVTEAMRHADVALYHAKSRGKGGYCIYNPDKGIRSLAEIRADVLRAINAGEMQLHYQPKVISKSGQVESVEALIRWYHPERGMIPPGDFIPQVEQSSVVVALGEWVLRQALSDIKAWRDSGVHLNVAINIAARHFTSAHFADRVSQVVADSGLEASCIELEITEEAATGPLNSGLNIIGALKASGFKVALDDYGRGYSNLNRLAELEVDKIKIDRSLIENIMDNDRTKQIVLATAGMAEKLGCRLVAEGIETADQAAMLRKLGCHELQGFYYSKGLPSDQLMAWLAERQAPNVIKLQRKLAAQAS